LYIIKNKFNTKDRGVPESAAPVATATFATIVDPALRTMSIHKTGRKSF